METPLSLTLEIVKHIIELTGIASN